MNVIIQMEAVNKLVRTQKDLITVHALMDTV